MFATRINAKLATYASWRPDPGSIAVDAFSFTWDYQLIYGFPPFSIIGKTMAKISREVVEAILIVPLWPTQNWFPHGMNMITYHPIVFSAKHLYLPNKPRAKHPLHKNLNLMALRLSGLPSKNMDFVTKLRKSFTHHGEQTPERGMRMYLPNGKHFVSKGTCIPYIQA